MIGSDGWYDLLCGQQFCIAFDDGSVLTGYINYRKLSATYPLCRGERRMIKSPTARTLEFRFTDTQARSSGRR